MKHLTSLLFALLLTLSTFGNETFDAANTSYEAGDFAAAQTLYLELAEEYESAPLYFNLGNTYYRQNDFVSAILWYERARKLAPADENIKDNLALANARIVDKPRTEELGDLEASWREFVYNPEPGAWTFWSILAMCGAFALLAAFLFLKKPGLKRLTFYSGLAIIPVAIFFFILSYLQQNAMKVEAAIITSVNVYVKSAPSDTGTDVLILNAGTKVDLIRERKEGWVELKAPNGESGWLQKEHITDI